MNLFHRVLNVVPKIVSFFLCTVSKCHTHNEKSLAGEQGSLFCPSVDVYCRFTLLTRGDQITHY